MNLTIRPARQEDAGQLADLIRGIGYFNALKDETSSDTTARVARLLALNLADPAAHSLVVAADADGVIVGYTAVHWLPYLILRAPEGYVSELFVRESARGQGVGRRLLEEVRAEGLRRGCGRLSLLNMRERESYLRGFYRKAGWSEREDAANFVLPLD